MKNETQKFLDMPHTTGMLQPSDKVIGWAVSAHGTLVWCAGYSRDDAFAIARKRDAEWARPYTVRNGVKVIGC